MLCPHHLEDIFVANSWSLSYILLMSKSIDKGWVCLTVARIVSVALAIFAVGLLFPSLKFFLAANQSVSSANPHPNAAESQQHSQNFFIAIFEGGFFVVMIAISIILFVIACTVFFTTTRKLAKKAAAAKQLSAEQLTPPQPSQQSAELPITEIIRNEPTDQTR